MAVFLALIIPLPFVVKRKLFSFISESPIIAKLQYGLKVKEDFLNVESSFSNTLQITFIFILILFLDSVNRVYRVQQELAAFTKDGSAVG